MLRWEGTPNGLVPGIERLADQLGVAGGSSHINIKETKEGGKKEELSIFAVAKGTSTGNALNAPGPVKLSKKKTNH